MDLADGDDPLLRSVEALLSEDDEASSKDAAVAPSSSQPQNVGPSTSAYISGLQQQQEQSAGPNPMVALAAAMLESQGPRPTFADFGAVPSDNPFHSSERGCLSHADGDLAVDNLPSRRGQSSS